MGTPGDGGSFVTHFIASNPQPVYAVFVLGSTPLAICTAIFDCDDVFHSSLMKRVNGDHREFGFAIWAFALVSFDVWRDIGILQKRGEFSNKYLNM